MKKKIFTMLVALFAMTTGAWALPAQNYLYLEVDGTSATVKYGDDKGTKPYYGEDPRDPDNYGWYVVTDESMPNQVTDFNGKNSLTTVTIDASCQNYTGTTLESFFDFWSGLTTINNLENLNTSEVTNMKRMFVGCSSMTSFDLSGLNTAKVTKMRQMFNSVSVETLDLSSFNTSSVTDMYCMFYNCPNLKNIYVGDGWSTASVTESTLMFGKCTNLPGFDSDKVTHEMAKLTTDGGYLQVKPESPDLTLNTDSTEATIEEMPAYDVTVDYELVRDMSIQMTATMGDGTDGVGYRVKKAQQGEGYEPADLNMMQVLALVAVNDGIEQKVLTLDQDYFCRIYKLDEQTLQPTGEGVKLNDFDFAPGRYALKAFPKDDTDYVGETALSNTFKLFVGYEVQVDGGEYATYYKDEKLKLDESVDGGVLYTISSVSATEAMLSDQINVAPALTPLIVHNSSAEAKTFILLPTEDQADEVQYAPEFKGTLTGTTIAASTTDQTNYALNGKQFVWVKNALSIAANKCWLEVVNSNARAISILFTGETTGIATATRTEATGDLYDLNGRKVLNPTRKGIYIQNGKKVVIK